MPCHAGPPNRLFAAGLLLGMAALAAAPALGERADRFRPTNVESDKLQYDDLKQISIFTGAVVLTRGTITLKGDRLILSQDPEGYQRGTVTGRLASFRQKRDGVDEWVEGYAEDIEYDGKTEKVRLTRKAKVRRLEGTRVVDEIDGAVIVYDSLTEQFEVDGRTPTGPPAPGTGRVRVVIQPRLGEPGSAPSAPSPAPAPGKPALPLGAAAPAAGSKPAPTR
ncbi:MAG: lipopolysaccharide transport periplasmic protein LptA [Burkholderiales bacterium]|nr:lipopolysaccharide transport periplasmic protein LptA [Burkholderiales bacterium]